MRRPKPADPRPLRSHRAVGAVLGFAVLVAACSAAATQAPTAAPAATAAAAATAASAAPSASATGSPTAAVPTAAPAASRAPAARRGSVTIATFAFSPASLTVAVGAKVTWTNTDAVGHTVTADNGSFGSQRLATGSAFSRTFSKAGTYAYHCAIHSYMTATIVVH